MVFIFNPFTKIAGGKALWIGGLFAILTLAISYFSHSAFDGVIDFHVAPFTSIWPYVSFYIISWLCLVLFLGLTGLLFTKTRFRWIDILGTTLLSRAPLLLAALAAFAIPYIDKEQLSDITQIHFTAGFFIASFFSLICIIWTVALYYNSYRVCINIYGSKAVWTFILALILAEITSLVFIHSIHFK